MGVGSLGAGTKSFNLIYECRVKIGIKSLTSLVALELFEMSSVPGEEVLSSALYIR